MENEYIKKGGLSIYAIITFAIVGVFIFGALFQFMVANGSESDLPIDGNYTEAYYRINATQGNIDTTVNDIRDAANTVTEEGNTLNGIKGLLTIFKLPGALLSYLLSPLELLSVWIPGLPTGAKVAIISFVTLSIVFAIFKLISGRTDNP